MIEGYKEFKLGNEAIVYIRKWLEEVGMGLGKALLQTQTLKSGLVTTMLPNYVSEESARDFEAGPHKEPRPETHFIDGKGGRWVRKSTAISCLVEIIQDFLGCEGNVVVFESYMPRATDPWFKRGDFKSQIFVLRDELYHIVSWRDTRIEKIRATIKEPEAPWPPIIGAMTSIFEESNLFHEVGNVKVGRLREEDFKMLAERTQKIIVGAYDGEGYLIWSKTGQNVQDSN